MRNLILYFKLWLSKGLPKDSVKSGVVEVSLIRLSTMKSRRWLIIFSLPILSVLLLSIIIQSFQIALIILIVPIALWTGITHVFKDPYELPYVKLRKDLKNAFPRGNQTVEEYENMIGNVVRKAVYFYVDRSEWSASYEIGDFRISERNGVLTIQEDFAISFSKAFNAIVKSGSERDLSLTPFNKELVDERYPHGRTLPIALSGSEVKEVGPAKKSRFASIVDEIFSF